MRAKYASPCGRCGQRIAIGEDCEYRPAEKKIYHWNCPSGGASPNGSEADQSEKGQQTAPAELAKRLGFE